MIPDQDQSLARKDDDIKKADVNEATEIPNKTVSVQTQALRTYMQVKGFKTALDLAKHLGLPRNTVRHMLHGDSKSGRIEHKTRNAIYAATGLKEFLPQDGSTIVPGENKVILTATSTDNLRDVADDAIEKLNEIIKKLFSDERRSLPNFDGNAMTSEQHAVRIKHLLRVLDQELDYFKLKENEQARDVLRQRIDAKEI